MKDTLEFAIVLVAFAIILVIAFASLKLQRKPLIRYALVTCAIAAIIVVFLWFANVFDSFHMKARFLIALSVIAIGAGLALYRLATTSSNENDLAALKLLEDLICNIDDQGVIITNNIGQIIDMNLCGEKLLGYEKNELRHRHIAQLFWVSPGKSVDPQADYFFNYDRSGSAASLLCAMRKKNGSVIKLNVFTRHYIGVSTLFNIYIFTQRDSNIPIKQVYQEFFKSSSVFFLVLDQNGRVVMMNRYGSTLLGCTEAEAIGKNWINTFIHPDDAGIQEEVRTGLSKEAGHSASFNSRILAKNGAPYLIRWTARRFKNPADANLYILYWGHDISPWEQEQIQMINSLEYVSTLKSKLEQRVAERTRELEAINVNLKLHIEERKSIEEKLIASQRLHNAVVDNFPDGLIAVINNDLNIIMVNGKELSALKLTKEALIGKSIFDQSHGLLSPDAESAVLDAFEGRTNHFDYFHNDFAYSVNVVPLSDGDSRTHEVLIVMHNVTEHKKLEQTLYKSIEQEKKLNELKSRFITMASHEFRTPLSTILSSIFLLENYSGEVYETKKQVHINRIKRTVNILTHTLNDFLRLGKLEEAQVEVILNEVNLPELVKECESEIRPLLKSEQEIIYTHDGVNYPVILDINLFRSILTNLLSNAVKYSGEGGTIIIRSTLMNDKVMINVCDNGIGIPEEEQSHIFERFFRGLNALNIEGTGIGLHIVKSYVEMMKGTISFVSSNTGTTFTVDIPLRFTSDGEKLTIT